jgi:hypothetical protein
MLEPKQLKRLLNQCAGVEVYAFQAKDPELISKAVEFRKRAERRLGEVMRDLPKAKGGGEKGVGRRGKNAGPPRPHIKPLADYGIDKNLGGRLLGCAKTHQINQSPSLSTELEKAGPLFRPSWPELELTGHRRP